MKRFKFLFVTFITSLMISCGTTNTVPITGRKQNLLISDAQVLSLSNQQYQQYLKSAKPSADITNTAMVKRVGQRLANAVVTYLNNNGLSSEVKEYQWEFNLIQNKEANAFCMPGGKIVVYEGLLPYTQNEASLAIVLGHEIAHAVAKHSAEQMSKQLRAQYGTEALGLLLNKSGSDTSSLAQEVFGFGANSMLRKYSRDNENEADYMGLIFAAMAGYDPSVALSFWQRMAESNFSKVPEFFSDHPSDTKRIAAIQKELPIAMKYYKAIPSNPKNTKTWHFSSSKNNTTKNPTFKQKK